MYVYAYSQINLIADSTILLIVLIAGLVVSFLCAAAEMAIASLDQAELETLNVKNQALLEARRRMNQSDHAQQLDYIKRHRQILQIMEIYYSANALNAPIVIFNNIANILIASLLPVALVTGNRNLHHYRSLVMLFLGLERRASPLLRRYFFLFYSEK
jgi:CBS domain containing-hemolysin-like protein